MCSGRASGEEMMKNLTLWLNVLNDKINNGEDKMTAYEYFMKENDLEIGDKFKLKSKNGYELTHDFTYEFGSFRKLTFEEYSSKFNDFFIQVIDELMNGKLIVEKILTITEETKQYLRLFDLDKFKWIACDENGQVCLYKLRPNRFNDIEWHGGCYTNIGSITDMPNVKFDFITWDDEPMLIEDII